jgi:hypothetical protein
MVVIPAKGPAVVLLNAQQTVEAGRLEAAVDGIGLKTRLPVRFRQAAADDPARAARKLLDDTNTVAAVILVTDEPEAPSLLIAPEARWARVNVAPLGKGEAQAVRAVKEVWRAYGYLMGAANSNFPKSLMRPVGGPDDLDGLLPDALCHEGMMKIQKQAEERGTTPSRRYPYRKAVEEGWAQPPTNDLQKTVWDEVKAKSRGRD